MTSEVLLTVWGSISKTNVTKESEHQNHFDNIGNLQNNSSFTVGGPFEFLCDSTSNAKTSLYRFQKCVHLKLPKVSKSSQVLNFMSFVKPETKLF